MVWTEAKKPVLTDKGIEDKAPKHREAKLRQYTDTLKGPPTSGEKIKIGELQEWEKPYITEGYKYITYVMVNRELPIGDIFDIDENLFRYLYAQDFELVKVAEATRQPKDIRILLTATRDVDMEMFQKKFAGRKEYYLYLRSDKKIGIEDLELQITDWLREEDIECPLCEPKKISMFPWEKRKLIKSTPIRISREKFEELIKRLSRGRK